MKEVTQPYIVVIARTNDDIAKVVPFLKKATIPVKRIKSLGSFDLFLRDNMVSVVLTHYDIPLSPKNNMEDAVNSFTSDCVYVITKPDGEEQLEEIKGNVIFIAEKTGQELANEVIDIYESQQLYLSDLNAVLSGNGVDWSSEDNPLLKVVRNRDRQLGLVYSKLLQQQQWLDELGDFVEMASKEKKGTDFLLSSFKKRIKKAQMLATNNEILSSYLFNDSEDFFSKLRAKNGVLTIENKRLLLLMKMGMTNKEISQILGVLPESIARSQLRLRHKLGVPKGRLRFFIDNLN